MMQSASQKDFATAQTSFKKAKRLLAKPFESLFEKNSFAGNRFAL